MLTEEEKEWYPKYFPNSACNDLLEEINRLEAQLAAAAERERVLEDANRILTDRYAEAMALCMNHEGNNARLREAIEKHRHNIWGESKVEHDEDIVLYEALEGK